MTKPLIMMSSRLLMVSMRGVIPERAKKRRSGLSNLPCQVRTHLDSMSVSLPFWSLTKLQVSQATSMHAPIFEESAQGHGNLPFRLGVTSYRMSMLPIRNHRCADRESPWPGGQGLQL